MPTEVSLAPYQTLIAPLVLDIDSYASSGVA